MRNSELVRILVDLLDTIIFLWLAIKGLIFIWIGGGGYIIFWGCALVCTSVYWKGLKKDGVVSSVENIVMLFMKR